jgi:hypothetical protein
VGPPALNPVLFFPRRSFRLAFFGFRPPTVLADWLVPEAVVTV